MDLKTFFKDLFKSCLRKGFRIGCSTGKPFDPHNQERTSAMEDFLNPRKKKNKDKRGGKYGNKNTRNSVREF